MIIVEINQLDSIARLVHKFIIGTSSFIQLDILIRLHKFKLLRAYKIISLLLLELILLFSLVLKGIPNHFKLLLDLLYLRLELILSLLIGIFLQFLLLFFLGIKLTFDFSNLLVEIPDFFVFETH